MGGEGAGRGARGAGLVAGSGQTGAEVVPRRPVDPPGPDVGGGGSPASGVGVEVRPAGAQRRLGMVLERMGDRSGAQKALETAVRQAPEDATSRLVLGRLLLGEGQTLEAVQQLEKAVQLNPNLSGAFYALSQARTRLGEAEAAREALSTFRRLKEKEMAELDARNTGYDDELFMRVLAAGFHTEAAGLLLRQRQPARAEAHLREAILIAPGKSGRARSWPGCCALPVDGPRLATRTRSWSDFNRPWRGIGSIWGHCSCRSASKRLPRRS
ncbi:MAG: tetratricopeptide repeat protein [Verrucomicrobia bacterium]|nr:tetratricopeptide repeat protein [Verrucomicrobiota bacterium]